MSRVEHCGCTGREDESVPRSIVIVAVGGIFCHLSEAVGRAILIGQKTELPLMRQAEVEPQLHLGCRSVLYLGRSLHVIHLRMIHQQLGSGIAGGHIVGRNAVVVFLIGIKISQARRLSVESETTAQVEPGCQ